MPADSALCRWSVALSQIGPGDERAPELGVVHEAEESLLLCLNELHLEIFYFFLGRITKSAYHPLIIGNEQLCIGLANFVVIPQHFDAQRTPRHVLECACIQGTNSHRGKGVQAARET